MSMEETVCVDNVNDCSKCEDLNNSGSHISDQIIAAVDELTLDAEDIQKATAESLCLDDEGRQSIASFASTAEHIKEIIHQTLKCRQEKPIDTEEISPAENCIQEKLAALEKVIQNSDHDKPQASNGSTEGNLHLNCGIVPDLPVTTQDMEHKGCCAKAHGHLGQYEDTSTMNLPAEIPNAQFVTPKITSDTREEPPKTNNSTTTTKPVSASLQLEEKIQKATQKHRKGEKTAEHIFKSLSQCQSTEDKLRVLCGKHAEALEENRSLESRLRQRERQVVQMTKEKDHLQTEFNRNTLARSRLESLCRELQRQNKIIKDESLQRIREEEEKRREISAKFQSTLGDISTSLNENKKRDDLLREENLQMASKLKALVDHYDTWEKHMEKVLQQKDLENQLSKAKLGKALLQQQGEREQGLREKQQLLENMTAMQKKGAELATTELQLRTELALYTSKYEEFQGVLSKSNQVFANFKVDMEKMSKKIKVLEKETIQWKSKWENSNRALLEMAADKQKRDQELTVSNQRIATLEKLCRALQAERNDLKNMCKSEIPESDAVESDAVESEVLSPDQTTNGNAE